MTDRRVRLPVRLSASTFALLGEEQGASLFYFIFLSFLLFV